MRVVSLYFWMSHFHRKHNYSVSIIDWNITFRYLKFDLLKSCFWCLLTDDTVLDESMWRRGDVTWSIDLFSFCISLGSLKCSLNCTCLYQFRFSSGSSGIHRNRTGQYKGILLNMTLSLDTQRFEETKCVRPCGFLPFLLVCHTSLSMKPWSKKTMWWNKRTS